jgi:hypothetical protein
MHAIVRKTGRHAPGETEDTKSNQRENRQLAKRLVHLFDSLKLSETGQGQISSTI